VTEKPPAHCRPHMAHTLRPVFWWSEAFLSGPAAAFGWEWSCSNHTICLPKLVEDQWVYNLESFKSTSKHPFSKLFMKFNKIPKENEQEYIFFKKKISVHMTFTSTMATK
jgi:hypothetical protein